MKVSEAVVRQIEALYASWRVAEGDQPYVDFTTTKAPLYQLVGGATVKLVDDGGETVLSYTVDASVGGKLAQIGSRLIDATAKKMADDFFSRFAETVAGPVAVEEGGPQAAGEARRLPAYLWVGGIVAIVIILLLVFANM